PGNAACHRTFICAGRHRLDATAARPAQKPDSKSEGLAAPRGLAGAAVTGAGCGAGAATATGAGAGADGATSAGAVAARGFKSRPGERARWYRGLLSNKEFRRILSVKDGCSRCLD